MKPEFREKLFRELTKDVDQYSGGDPLSVKIMEAVATADLDLLEPLIDEEIRRCVIEAGPDAIDRKPGPAKLRCDFEAAVDYVVDGKAIGKRCPAGADFIENGRARCFSHSKWANVSAKAGD